MNTSIDGDVFNEFPVLETQRLVLRQFTLKDTDALFGLRGNEEVMQYMDRAPHYTAHDSESMIKAMSYSFQMLESINWAIELKDKPGCIGYAGIRNLMWQHARAEIHYALAPDLWGQGIMSEAMPAVIDFAFNKMTLHGIEANINPNNARSEKLLLKLGFKKEAHFRENYLFEDQFLDSVIYCLLETDI